MVNMRTVLDASAEMNKKETNSVFEYISESKRTWVFGFNGFLDFNAYEN